LNSTHDFNCQRCARHHSRNNSDSPTKKNKTRSASRKRKELERQLSEERRKHDDVYRMIKVDKERAEEDY
jgi:hypothetical protein